MYKTPYQIYLDTAYAIRLAYDLANRMNVIELKKVQVDCLHPADKVSYNPDPSGNNDSWYECSLCGCTNRKELKRS